MKTFYILPLPPLAFILLFNVFHAGNVMNSIGLSMHLVERFGASDLQVGMLGSVQLVSYGAMAWMGGFIADRIPKRPLILIGLILLASGFYAVPHARSMTTLFVIAGFCSLVQMIVFPPYWGWVAETVGPDRVSRALGVNGISLVFCAMSAAFGVGRLYAHYGPTTTFGVSFWLCVFSAVLLIFCPPKREESSASRDGKLEKPHEEPSIAESERWKFFLAVLALNATGFFVAITHQTFLVRLGKLPEFSLPLPLQSNIHMLRMFCGAGGYALGAFWNGWHWRRWPFWVAAVWLGIASLLAFVAPNAWVLGGAMALGGVATSFGNQMGLFYCVGSGVLGRGRGAGVNESALALGGAVGPFLGGIAAQFAQNPRAALLVPIAPLGLCAVAWSIIWRDGKE